MMNTPSATARSRASGRLRLMLLSIMTVLFVSACSQRIGVSWADLTIANANQDILVAYENSITLVSRVNGFVVTEDMEGTTNNPDAAGTWRLRNSDAGSEYFTTPLRVGEVDGDQMLIIADYNNRLYYANFDRACFSTQLGSCVDQEPPFVELAGHVVADLGEDDERIYVPFAENDVVALNKGIYASDWDRDDDQERRRRFDETLTTAWTFETERGVWAQPVVLDGSVYIATMDHRLHRLDAETGEEQATIDLGSAIASSPVLYDGTPATDYADDVAVAPDPEYDLENARFFVGTFGRRIYEVPLNFRSGDGEELPVFETDGWVWGAPKIYDGVLYTADLNGNIYAVDITDGFNELWRVNPGVGGFRASPLVTDDFIIVASRDGIVLWLQRETGAEFTRQDVRNEVLADLLILPGDAEADREPLVIVSTVNNSRVMVAFTLDGAPRWTYPSS